jgi:hypothetical protein
MNQTDTPCTKDELRILEWAAKGAPYDQKPETEREDFDYWAYALIQKGLLKGSSRETIRDGRKAYDYVIQSITSEGYAALETIEKDNTPSKIIKACKWAIATITGAVIATLVAKRLGWFHQMSIRATEISIMSNASVLLLSFASLTM